MLAQHPKLDDDDDDDVDLDLFGDTDTAKGNSDAPASQDQAGDVKISEEEKRWKEKALETQCEEVLNLLKDGRRKWDRDCGGEDIPVLEEYIKTTLANTRETPDTSFPTALHKLAKKAQHFQSAASDHNFTKLIAYLKENDEVLAYPRRGGRRENLVLTVAIKYKNLGFVDCLKKTCTEEAFRDLVHLQDDKGMNCLHQLCTASKDERKVQRPYFLRWLKLLGREASADTLATADNRGNTPIHYLVNLANSATMREEYVEIVKTMISKCDEQMERNRTLFNIEGESPVLYGRRSIDSFKKNRQRRLEQQATQEKVQRQVSSETIPMAGPSPLTSKETMPGHTVDKNGDGGSARKDNIRAVREPPSSERSDGHTPAPKGRGDQLNETGTVPPSIRGIRRTLSIRATQRTGPENAHLPPTIEKHARFQSAAGSLRRPSVDPGDRAVISSVEKPNNPEGEPWEACEELVEFLEIHYLRTRSDLEARELIYGKDGFGKFHTLLPFIG